MLLHTIHCVPPPGKLSPMVLMDMEGIPPQRGFLCNQPPAWAAWLVNRDMYAIMLLACLNACQRAARGRHRVLQTIYTVRVTACPSSSHTSPPPKNVASWLYAHCWRESEGL